MGEVGDGQASRYDEIFAATTKSWRSSGGWHSSVPVHRLTYARLAHFSKLNLHNLHEILMIVK